MPDQDEYLTRAEVAELFDVHPHTVWNWSNTGILRAVKTPTGRRRYRRSDVEALAAKHAQDAS